MNTAEKSFSLYDVKHCFRNSKLYSTQSDEVVYVTQKSFSTRGARKY